MSDSNRAKTDPQSLRVAVIGASGFVGSHVVKALHGRGLTAIPVKAPRLTSDHVDDHYRTELAQLSASIDKCAAVINAAGLSSATTSSKDHHLANAVMPELVARATHANGQRFIHISSAAVQGRTKCLDASLETTPFSPYSSAKASGEHRILAANPRACIYRPPGVHGIDRAVTARLAAYARSRWAMVAAPGTSNTPQALITNVADAIAHLASTNSQLPTVVHHPSEHMTVTSILSTLGGKSPARLPRRLAHLAVAASFAAGKLVPSILGHARRLEVLMMGQRQAPSWLTDDGWEPPVGQEGWIAIGKSLQTDAAKPSSHRVLIVTSVASMVNNFLLPHISQLQSVGLDVTVATNFSHGSTISDEQLATLQETLQGMSVTQTDITFTRRPLTTGNFRSLLTLTKLLRGAEYRFVHAHTPTGGLVARIAGIISRTPVVYTAHGFHFTRESPGIEGRLFYFLELALSRFTHLLITINSEDTAIAASFRAKHHAHTNGIGVAPIDGSSTLDLRSALKLSPRTTLLLSVGELNRNKNHGAVIRALSSMVDLDYHYVIVGHGDMRELNSLRSEYRVESSVTLLGYHPDARKLSSQADVFVHPSEREGLPVALAEALLAGTPAVASDIRGNRDLVQHMQNGLLFDLSDPHSLQDALRHIMEDQTLRKQLAVQARATMSAWTLEKVIPQTLQAYAAAGLLPECAPPSFTHQRRERT